MKAYMSDIVLVKYRHNYILHNVIERVLLFVKMYNCDYLKENLPCLHLVNTHFKNIKDYQLLLWENSTNLLNTIQFYQ